MEYPSKFSARAYFGSDYNLMHSAPAYLFESGAVPPPVCDTEPTIYDTQPPVSETGEIPPYVTKREHGTVPPLAGLISKEDKNSPDYWHRLDNPRTLDGSGGLFTSVVNCRVCGGKVSNAASPPCPHCKDPYITEHNWNRESYKQEKARADIVKMQISRDTRVVSNTPYSPGMKVIEEIEENKRRWLNDCR